MRGVIDGTRRMPRRGKQGKHHGEGTNAGSQGKTAAHEAGYRAVTRCTHMLYVACQSVDVRAERGHDAGNVGCSGRAGDTIQRSDLICRPAMLRQRGGDILGGLRIQHGTACLGVLAVKRLDVDLVHVHSSNPASRIRALTSSSPR